VFAIGTTSVTCEATDAAGNTSSVAFDVTVVDTTAPALQLPHGVVQEATGPSGAKVTFATSSLDLVDGGGSATCAPASGSTFALGTTHVTCTATDEHGNTGSGTFDVVVRDTTAPTLTITGNAGIYDVDATVLLSCTASDLVSSATCSPASISAPAWSYGAGARSVSFTARDAAGNVGTATAAFTVSPTVDGMVRLTTSLVTKAQLTSSLEAKLRAGNYDGYRKELDQQVGKGVGASDARLLSDLSLALPPPVSPAGKKK
jgi:hypothetical protein